METNECPEILKDFLAYLSGIKNYSYHTIKNYYLDLMIFFKFIKEYMEIEVDIKDFNVFILANVQEKDIIAFLVYLNYYKDNTAQTRQRRLSSIRTFYKWLFINYPPFNGRENPTKYVPNIEPVIRLPKYLNLEQARNIQEVFNLTNSRFPLRDNTIISMFIHTGMRLSELININVQDIDFYSKTIRVVGKNNKERTIYINKILMQKLEKYLKWKNKDNKIIVLDEPLFLNKNGNRIGVDGVENICEKAFKLIGLGEYGYTTHVLRHSAATIIYKYTNDIFLLKEFLGHSCIEATEIYTHINNIKVKQAVENNPLNDFKIKKIKKIA